MNHLRDLLSKARIRHLYFDRAIRAAVSQITFAPPGTVIAIVGPTRVGKSTAIREAARQVYPGKQKTSIPYVIVDCSRTDAGFTSTRYLTLDLLTQLEHPLYVDASSRLRLSLTETNARLQLRRAITYRDTKLIIIDEAHHLLRMKNSAGREAALESLKCLGNETGALIVLVGGYELLKGCFTSAHFNGRLTLLEFPRYGASEADQGQFNAILASLDAMLPWASGHSLLRMRDLIYKGSQGSCGLITNWILAALGNMTAGGCTRLRQEHFKAVRFTQQLEAIASEIEYGESLLVPIEGTDCKTLAGIVDQNEAVANRSPKRRTRPGRRNPKRDSREPLKVAG